MRDSANLSWLLTALLVAGCSTQPEAITDGDTFTGLGNQPIFVVSHGWHTGIVLAADRLTAGNPVLKQRFGDARYLEVGWGDEVFYQAEQVTFDVLLGAALWPTRSVVHVVDVPVSPAVYFANSDITLLCATDAQARALAAFIADSFARDPSGQIIERQRGIYGDSQFFAGKGTFHLFSTCNKWTAKGLRSLGMEIDPTLKLTAESVSSYLAEYKGASAVRPLHAECPATATGE